MEPDLRILILEPTYVQKSGEKIQIISPFPPILAYTSKFHIVETNRESKTNLKCNHKQVVHFSIFRYFPTELSNPWTYTTKVDILLS